MFCIVSDELNFCCVFQTLHNLMETQNNVTEFVFIGLWGNKKIDLLFFFLFLLCYLAALLGNFTVSLTITCSLLMQQPMHCFLCHLSLMDVSYTSTVVQPRGSRPGWIQGIRSVDGEARDIYRYKER